MKIYVVAEFSGPKLDRLAIAFKTLAEAENYAEATGLDSEVYEVELEE